MKNVESPLRIKTTDFAVRIVNLSRFLVEKHKEFVISKQILESGTNPGAMIREAQNAESTLDFVHKLGIAQKEASETEYWLELLFRTNLISKTEHESLNNNLQEILKMLKSSIITKRANDKK